MEHLARLPDAALTTAAGCMNSLSVELKVS
jgi:hypothetical protein